jgi:DNA repair protein RadC
MHEGHRSRLKERFLKEGLDSFEPHNIVELLLFFGIPYKDTNEIAHDLISTFGSLSGVIDASYEDLVKIKGVGENAATLIKLIAPLSRAYMDDKYSQGEILNTTEAAGKFLLGKYRFRDDEFFSMTCVDSNCRLISFNIVSQGSINATEVSVRKAVEIAVKTSANGVIIAHNHPGGLALPSQADIFATQKLIDALRMINVYVIDHIIICGEDYVSLAQSKKYKNMFAN